MHVLASRKGAATLSRGWALLVGAAAGAACFAGYAPGSGRSLDFDGAVTFAEFVVAPHWIDPLHTQVRFNNHPALSFVELVVFRVTNSTSEATYRILTIAFTALAVALLAALIARRRGALAGATAGMVLAANPLVYRLSREVRGYSLLLLCAVVSTALLLHLVRRRSTPLQLAYVAVLTLALMTHLYACGLLVCHVLHVVRDAGGDHRVSRWPALLGRRWCLSFTVPLLAAAVVYAPMLRAMLGGSRNYRFDSLFPARLLVELAGGWPPAALVLPLAVVVAASLRRRWPWVVTAVALVVGTPWLTGTFTFFRFYIWLVPLAGVAAAMAVDRWRVLVVALILIHVPVSTRLWSTRDVDPLANRVAGAVIADQQRKGHRVCVLGDSSGTVRPYARNYLEVRKAELLDQCEVAIVVRPDPLSRPLSDRLARRLPVLTPLPAAQAGWVRSSDRVPVPSSEPPLLGRRSTSILRPTCERSERACR